MPKITKRAVDAFKPAERERVVWDDDIKGFGVRVHPTGRKVYIVKYRHEGRAVKATIGPHGPITPAAARARAAEIVTLARTGRNLEGKTPRGKAGGATMADLARRFLGEYAPVWSWCRKHPKVGTSRKIRIPALVDVLRDRKGLVVDSHGICTFTVPTRLLGLGCTKPTVSRVPVASA